MMKFALIVAHEFKAIYFESEQLAKDAKQKIDEITGGSIRMCIVRVAEDEPPKMVQVQLMDALQGTPALEPEKKKTKFRS